MTLAQQREELNNFAREQANAMTVPYCGNCGAKLGEKQADVPNICPSCSKLVMVVRMRYPVN